MNNEYYVIMRKYYGLPDYLSTDMSDEDEVFSFDTKSEANKCLRGMYENGEWIEHERFGKVRYYVERRSRKNE